MSGEKSVRTFGSLDNGNIVIETLRDDDLEELIKVFDAFIEKECVSNGTEMNLPESEEARNEFRQLCREVGKDGISLVARHVPTNTLVGGAFNKFLVKSNSSFYDNFKSRIRTPCMKSIMDYLLIMEGEIDFYEKYNCDSGVELSFLCTASEFEGKKIGRALSMYTLELCRDLANGIGLDRLPPEYRNYRPKIVVAVFTSRFSQKIGQNIGFDFLNDVPYTKFTFNGKTYADRIGPMHPSSVLAVKKVL